MSSQPIPRKIEISILDTLDFRTIDELSDEDTELVLKRLEWEEGRSDYNPFHERESEMKQVGRFLQLDCPLLKYHRFKTELERVKKSDWMHTLIEGFHILELGKFIGMQLHDILDEVRTSANIVKEKMKMLERAIHELHNINVVLVK